MIEKERKFKLKYLPDNLESVDIQQGYLMFDGRKHLRCRIIDGECGYLTYKDVMDNKTKNEFEYPIPIEDANELMESCEFKLRKKRFTKIDFNGEMSICFDFIYEPIITSFIEIEYTNEMTTIPEYCGEEITDDENYSNINIARKYGKV
jgi:CYTH domain-containing protein